MSEETMEEFQERIINCTNAVVLVLKEHPMDIILAAAPIVSDYAFKMLIDSDMEKSNKLSLIHSYFDCFSEILKAEWARKHHEELNIKVGCECNKKWGSEIK